MARTVDPARHAARRLRIIDAALTRFAADGYEATTTAAICAEARIGSGTFFHYFPTKADVLLGILDLGTAETTAWFDEQSGREDAVGVLRDWIDQTIEDFSDRRMAGFVRAVGAVMSRPEFAAALAADDRATQTGLLGWVELAQQQGSIRTDLTAARLTSWLTVLTDGFADRIATDDGFTAGAEGPVLRDAVHRLLGPEADESGDVPLR